MVFESEWEKAAMNGDELPKGLEYPEQVYFMSLRLLYDSLRRGIIDRTTAIREKRELMDEYRAYRQNWSMADIWTKVILETELARAEYRKNPCHENAMKLIEVIEGRKYGEPIPESL